MEIEYSNIKVIGFDADDTLWVNETYFRDAEVEFGKLLSQFETINKIDQELFKKELENLPIYGYGIKGFVLSMVELALEISNNTVSNATIKAILDIGKDMTPQLDVGYINEGAADYVHPATLTLTAEAEEENNNDWEGTDIESQPQRTTQQVDSDIVMNINSQ